MGIQFKKVSHIYRGIASDDQAIIDIDLKISRKNEIVAIVGETGSGKSTLLQHMNALLLPSTGQLNILGQRILPASSVWKDVARKSKKKTLDDLENEFDLLSQLVASDYVNGSHQELALVIEKIGKGLENSTDDSKGIDVAFSQLKKATSALQIQTYKNIRPKKIDISYQVSSEKYEHFSKKHLEVRISELVQVQQKEITNASYRGFRRELDRAGEALSRDLSKVEIDEALQKLNRAYRNLTIRIPGKIVKYHTPKLLKPLRQKIGLVFQFPEYQLFADTVLADIMFGPRNFGNSQADATEKAVEAAGLVGVEEELFARSPFTLSGGQMRKVAIAGILAMEPEILVLDEPTRGLDPVTRDEVMRVFEEIHNESEKTIVLITHDMDLVADYATRVVVLNNGKIAYDGDKVELFTNHDVEKYGLSLPSSLKVMKELSSELGIPYQPLFKFSDIISYLEEVAASE